MAHKKGQLKPLFASFSFDSEDDWKVFKETFRIAIAWLLLPLAIALATPNYWETLHRIYTSRYYWTSLGAFALPNMLLSYYTPWKERWSRKFAYVSYIAVALVCVWILVDKTFPGALPDIKNASAISKENVKFFEFDGKGELFITELKPTQKVVVKRAAGGFLSAYEDEKESPLCGYSYDGFGRNIIPVKGDVKNLHLDLYSLGIRPGAILAILRDKEDKSKDIFLNWPCHTTLNDPFVIKNPDGRTREVFLKYNYRWTEGNESKTVLLLAIEK